MSGISIDHATNKLYGNTISLCTANTRLKMTCLYLYLYAAAYVPGDGEFRTAQDEIAIIGKIEELQQECCDYKIAEVTPSTLTTGASPTPSPTTITIVYGTTSLDTTGAPPTLQEYLDSVTAATDKRTLQLAPGASLAVPLSGTAVDKVMYISVPVTELAFTRWSELYHPLQQWLLIDTEFGDGSSTFFMYTDTTTLTRYYITRVQTSFSDAVVLTR